MAHCDVEDLNGDLWIVGSEGEIEEERASRIIWLPAGVPAPGVEGVLAGLNQGHLDEVFRLNYRHLRAAPNALEPVLAANVAYLRMLVYRKGLLRPNNEMAAHHLKYNEMRQVGVDGAIMPAVSADDDAACNVAYNAVNRPAMRAQFTNMLCCVAFMFRQRGHHYLAEFDAKYVALWRKCLYDADGPGVPWEHIAHTAFHAVWPTVLDAYWAEAVAENRCAGALKKRFHCAPAGSAAPITLYTAVADMVAAFPAIKDMHKEELAWLTGEVRLITGPTHRWSGSVNNVFYRTVDQHLPHRVDEARLAALASKLMASVRAVDERNALLKSKALERIAAAAPITGGVFGLLVEAQMAFIKQKGSKLMASLGGGPLLERIQEEKKEEE